jgi:hypothetical protein
VYAWDNVHLPPCCPKKHKKEEWLKDKHVRMQKSGHMTIFAEN